jgi:hypothetical protein
MKNKSVRLTVASLVAVLSVLGLSQAPATAKVAHHHVAAKTGNWCC